MWSKTVRSTNTRTLRNYYFSSFEKSSSLTNSRKRSSHTLGYGEFEITNKHFQKTRGEKKPNTQ